MNFIKHLECTLCHEVIPYQDTRMTCPSCGETGILEIVYDYDAMKQIITTEYFKQNSDHSMLRYQPMMSIQPTTLQLLQVGWTPLYPATRLSQTLQLPNLYLKDETIQPTSSLKDRASLVACLKAIELGQDTICCSSTGNAASSLAGNAAKLGLSSLIVVPKRAPIGKLTQLVMYGSTVIQVEGDYKQAFDLSKQLIDQYQLYNRNAAINPHLVEGKKTVALEIAEQLDFQAPDYVVVSVGDGCTIAGVYKGFYDLYQLALVKHIPRIIGVQAEGCAPFVTAYETKQPLQETNEDTFADSIAVGIPRNPVKGMRAVTASNGFYLSVSDDAIRHAMNLLGRKEGLFAEPAGATALAGLIKAQETHTIPTDATIVVIITGNGLKDPTSVTKHVQEQTLHYRPIEDQELLQHQPPLTTLLHTLRERSEHHE